MKFIRKNRSATAISLVEMCIIVGVVGIIASLGYVVVSDAVNSAKKQKLASDVATLNRSVIAFIGTGGDISKASTPDAVLESLKKSVSNAGKIATLSGGNLDRRIKFILQTAEEARSDEARVYWNSSSNRFEIANSGAAPGIREFYLDETAAELEPGEREGSFAFQYASEDQWIWDYTEASAPPSTGTSVIPTTPASAPTPPPVVASPPPPSGLPTPLDPPTYSIPGGGYPITDFGINLTLSNSNPLGSSSIYYSIDYGDWILYAGSLNVDPDSEIRAMAVTNSPKYSSSAQAREAYSVSPIPLIKPIIAPSKPQFGLFSGRNINVKIINQNDSDISQLQYRLAGAPWQNYKNGFRLSRKDYLSGVEITARAIPNNPAHYLESDRTLRKLEVESATVTGTADGNFHSPLGADTMVAGGNGDYFEWGRDFWTNDELDSFSDLSTLSKSQMSFESQTFGSPASGNRFEVGNLNYFNGTVVSSTGADQVSFTADLNFDIGGFSDSTSFDFDFALINTENFEDPNDPWQDADYVRLLNPIANEKLVFNGIEFQLKLEFGETTDAGLANFDEFYVLEGKDATTKLYGTLIEVGEIEFNE